MNQNDTRQAIEGGQTVLGIEFGSTRIKAMLLGAGHTPIASGSYEWENRYENGLWTYHIDEVWAGLQASYRELAADVQAQYGVPLRTVACSWHWSGTMLCLLPPAIASSSLS